MNHIPSPDTSDAGIERDIKAVGADKFPRVTPADIEANIVSEHYFIASDALQQDSTVHVVRAKAGGWILGATQVYTICMLRLQNGYVVHGHSAPASEANFNADIGRKIARENAVAQLWPLMGYHLKQTLHEKATAPASDFLGRLRAEHHELNERLGKLEAFIDSPAYNIALPGIEQADLRTQAEQMREYSTTLSRRLGRLS